MSSKAGYLFWWYYDGGGGLKLVLVEDAEFLLCIGIVIQCEEVSCRGRTTFDINVKLFFNLLLFSIVIPHHQLLQLLVLPLIMLLLMRILVEFINM